MKELRTLFWRNGALYLIDQKALPHRLRYIKCRTYLDVAKAIKDMTVRGAPAIGVAAAYGLALAAKSSLKNNDAMLKRVKIAADVLRKTRPTAVNLYWGINRILKVAEEAYMKNDNIAKAVLEEAEKMAKEDVEINKKIGQNGAKLLPDKCVVMTYCNAGALATAGYGTALGVIRAAVEMGKNITVIVPETRPKLQGARLTAYELETAGINYRIITDNMASFILSKGIIDCIIVGADRILARTGHVTNKIGTLSLAISANYFKVPFYVAAPISTIDFEKTPEEIVIEERNEEEVLCFAGKRITLRNARAINFAFDITPPELVTRIITEEGVFLPSELINLKAKYQFY